MARQIVLLLIATLALGSGVYALRARKPPKRPVAAIAPNSPNLEAGATAVETLPAVEATAHEPVRFSPSTIARSRVALLVIVAAALTAGAYLGLGKGSPPAHAAQPANTDRTTLAAGLNASSQKESLVEDDILQFRAEAMRLAPPAAPTPSPAPATPVPATPAPTPAPVAAAFAAPTDGIEAIICALPWPCQQAIAVAACESGRDRYGRLDGAWATNGSHYGLFQISSIHASRWPDFYQDWMDPAHNAEWAYEIWAQQGWYPWSCRWAAYSN